MATTHTNIAQTGNIFTGFFDKIIEGLAAIAENNSRMKAVEYLNAMSDEELAEKGLHRADIVRHVFRDSFYV